MYEKFSKLLQSRGLKAADVSRGTGIHQVIFSDWKRGKSQPKYDKLKKIAKFFNVPVEYFTGEDEKSTSPKTERDAVNDFVNALSDEDFDRLSSVIKAVFPEKFKN